MSTPINFITASAASVRMAKEITADSVRPYPKVKRLNSETFFVPQGLDGLATLFDLLKEKSTAGAALIKGPLTEPIINESRRGKVDTNAPTTLMVLDIDGWVPDAPLTAPIQADDLRRLAESIVCLLPEPLCSTSYIVNASSSTGTKLTGEVGLHFFFLLDRAVAPRRLESYLKALNFCHADIEKRITLQASRMSLKWVVDPVVARNAQVVYIASPTFNGREDPFASPDDRWVLVTKTHGSCDLSRELAQVDVLQVQGQEEKTLTALRKDVGLGKFKPKMRNITLGGQKQQVVTNPDSMVLEFAYKTDRFVYWNINGGDSNAYYNPIGNPEIVYNFKGEAPFEMRAACPEAYDWYREHFKHEIRAVTEARPLVFRDAGSDQHYAVEFIPAHNTVEQIDKIALSHIEDWLNERGAVKPSPIPTWRLTFDPKSTTELDWESQTLNLFRATEYLRSPPALMPQYTGIALGGASEAMAALCPTIHKVIFHICGSNPEDFECFINWLAWCVQNREKAHTAWVFSGVPGTGKGVFYERILRPIIGERYAIRKRLDHLEEQFNAYQETALFLVWEEFRLGDSRQAGKLLNKIKDDIVADRINVRAMRTDVREAVSYTNYIFFSNHNDVLPIEEGDRRFNIATPQLTKLEHQYPQWRREIGRIDDELGSFAGFLANYIADEDMARTARETEAKQLMKETSMGFGQRFCHAVRVGELAYFFDLLDMQSTSSTGRALQMATAQKYLDAWMLDAHLDRPSVIPLDALLVTYEVMNDRDMPPAQFANFLRRRDVVIERQRLAGKPRNCVTVRWHLTEDGDREFVAERAEAIQSGSQHATHH